MDAAYQRSQARKVDVYLKEHFLENDTNFSHNDFVDKEITLKDKTTFNINSIPGSLHIKIDKTENSKECFERIRVVCEELNGFLINN